MTRQFKLAIVRARNDTSVPTISDQACPQMLMTGAQSVLRYWSDTTGGWLDLPGGSSKLLSRAAPGDEQGRRPTRQSDHPIHDLLGRPPG